MLLCSKEAHSLSSAASRKFNRREAVKIIDLALMSAILMSSPRSVIAEEETRQKSNRPYAPLQALLPVTRLKLWVDEAFAAATGIGVIQDASERYIALQRIDHVLSNRPNLFQGETERKSASPSTAQLTTAVSSANKDQYRQNRMNLDLGDKMNAMLNQADVERQWGILQYAERKREESNEMRAAFNFYTRQLTYGDEYLLTASKEERKKMIRNDELPTLSAVITSDLDQRDLYRNQFLTAIDDAIAESAYDMKLNAEELDLTDLIDLVKQAHDSIETWFSLIPSADVDDAIGAVQRMQ
jgi:hypothetical protein